MTTAIYARISRDAEGDELGVDRQLEACRELAARRGWVVSGEYVDNDVSASTRSTKPRPRYDALLAAVTSGDVTRVVAYSNSRLTRRPAEWIALIHLANAGQMEIDTVVSGKHDLTTADGRATALTVAAWDAAEAERIAERTKAQKRQALREGRPLGGRYRTLGYARDWSVIEGEAEIVREVFRRVLSGEPSYRVGLDLRTRGLVTTAGDPFTPLAVRRMVATSRYAGLEAVEGALIPSEAPALINEADWHAAQSPKVAKSVGVARSYLLTGFAICGSCMGTMSGGAGRYRCNAQTGGCGKVSISSAWLEEPVRLRVGGYHQQARHRADAVETVDLKPKIDVVDHRISALRASYDAGDLALEDLTPMLRREREKRAALVSEAADRQSVATAVEDTMRGLDEWTEAPIGVQRQILANYLSRVIVKPSGKGRQPRQGRDRMDVAWISGRVENMGSPDMMLIDLRHMMSST